jgi:hypothetical protein
MLTILAVFIEWKIFFVGAAHEVCAEYILLIKKNLTRLTSWAGLFAASPRCAVGFPLQSLAQAFCSFVNAFKTLALLYGIKF